MPTAELLSLRGPSSERPPLFDLSTIRVPPSSAVVDGVLQTFPSLDSSEARSCPKTEPADQVVRRAFGKAKFPIQFQPIDCHASHCRSNPRSSGRLRRLLSLNVELKVEYPLSGSDSGQREVCNGSGVPVRRR